MNNKKILTVILTVLMAGALFALVGPAAAQDVAPDQTQGEINLTLEPTTAEVDPGAEQGYEIIVENPDSGVSAYNFNISTTNQDAAEIVGWNETAFFRADQFSEGPLSRSNITDDGQYVTDGSYVPDGSTIQNGGDTLVMSAAMLDLTWDPAEEVSLGTVYVRAGNTSGATADLEFRSSAGDVPEEQGGPSAEDFESNQAGNLDAILDSNESVYTENQLNNGSMTVAQEQTGESSLNTTVAPGTAQENNDFTFTSNVSQVDNDTDIQNLHLDFADASGVNASDISASQVTVSIDGTSSSVDSVQQENAQELEIGLTDSFTIQGASEVEVTVDGVNVPNNGTFTSTFEYVDDGTLGTVDSSTDDYTIDSATQQPPAESALSGLDIDGQGSSATITEGDDASVSVDVENVGGQDGSFTVTVDVGGASGTATTGTLAPGASETVTVSGVTDGLANDSYTVDASTDDASVSGSLTVNADTAPTQAESALSNLLIAGQSGSATITAGTNEAITVEVENVGNASGQFTADLTLDGTTDSYTTGTLNPGETENATFTGVTGDLAPGSYSVDISTDDDSASGSLTVNEAGAPGAGPAPPEPPAPPIDETHVEDIVVTGGYLGGGNVGAEQVSGVTNIDGLTIVDDYPRNGSAIYQPTTGSIYDGTQSPIPSGQHTGVVGLPVQTDAYADYADLLNNYNNEPTQEVFVSAGIAQGTTEEETITVDFSEVYDLGLQINESQSSVSVSGFNTTSSDIDASAGEVTVTFQPDNANTSGTFGIDLVYEPQDPVEGLDVEDGWENPRVVAESANNDEHDRFVVAEAGATGISHLDARTGFIGANADDTDPIDSNNDANGEDNPGSFLVWQDQMLTFETAERGNTIDIYEVATSDGQYEAGDEVDIDGLGTAPGQVTTVDTSQLDPGHYFVEFESGTGSEVAVLHVKPLNLQAEGPDDAVDPSEDIEIDVTTQDDTGNAIEAWVRPEGSDEVADVIHVEEDELPGGQTDQTVYINPENDLNGPGNYTVTILHKESEVTTQTETIQVGDPSQDQVPADEVNIVSPSLTEPELPGNFDRGDIVPIELEFEGGNVGTVTFGDRDNNRNNVEINVTVWDENNDGEATIYLNTYQIGHGELNNDGNYVPNDASWSTGSWENRQHGFFTNPADNGSAIVGNVTAHDSIDIFGGSQGGAVVAALRYDFHSIGGFESFKAVGDRDDVNNIEIDQRSTDDFTLYTAPGGSDAPELETIADIEAAMGDTLTEIDVEDGVINGTVAEDDQLIVQPSSSGLEGIMHEAVVRNSSLNVDEFLNRSDDHFVTDEFEQALTETIPDPQPFGSADSLEMLDYNIEVSETDQSFEDRMGEVPENVAAGLEPVELDLETSSVIAGQGEDGNLHDYYIPYTLTPGSSQTVPPSDDLEGGQEFNVTLELEPNGGAQDFETGTQWRDYNVPANQELNNDSLGEEEYQGLDYVEPVVNVDNLRDGVLEVPMDQQNVTISGTSTMAPGTDLRIDVGSLVGEDTPFIITREAVDTEKQSGDAPATWSIETDQFDTTRDMVDIDPGTEFDVEVTKSSGGLGLVTPDGEPIPGQILEEPAVESFEFADQRSSGNSVVIEEFDANRDVTIELRDEDGNVIGESEVLNREETHETFAVAIDETLEQNTDVTAAAVIDNPVQESGDELATETAAITVEDAEPEPDPAEYRLSNFELGSTSIAMGDTLSASIDVENIGGETGNATVELTVGGDSLATEEVEVAGGATETVEFSGVEHGLDAGDYTVNANVDDRSASTSLTVSSPASFSVGSLTLSSESVEQGTSVDVSAAVSNDGDMEGDVEAALGLDGESQNSQSLTLAGGDSQTVEFTLDTSDLEPADYNVSVSAGEDSASSTLTVSNATDDGSEDDDADDDGAGFGVAVAALALLGAALLAVRRQVE